jgi:NAD(P)-dependent dehydrogenase (short-subunit alcohol dehydrogenase family)
MRTIVGKKGAKIVVADIDEVKSQKVVEKIKQGAGQAVFIKLDVSKENDWENAIERTLSELKK